MQLFQASPDRHNWTKFRTGVACFVKDNVKKTYYIRLVDIGVRFYIIIQHSLALIHLLTHHSFTSHTSPLHLLTHHSYILLHTFTCSHTHTHTHVQTRSIVFEQELFNQFTYKRDRPFFHSFPADVSYDPTYRIAPSLPLSRRNIFTDDKTYTCATCTCSVF